MTYWREGDSYDAQRVATVKERSWFRLEVAALAIVAAIVVYISLFPRHQPRLDDATLPKMPPDTTPVAR